MTLSNSLLYVPFISLGLFIQKLLSVYFFLECVSLPQNLFNLFPALVNSQLSLTVSFFILFFFAYHFLSTSPLPGRLSHIFVCFNSSAHSVSASSPFFPFFRPLIHNLCLDRKQRDGASVLMNNNRNWERHRERESESGILRQPPLQTVCLAGTWSLGLSARLSATVCFCLCQRSRPEPKFPHIMQSG